MSTSNDKSKGKELKRETIYTSILHPFSFSKTGDSSIPSWKPVFCKIELTNHTYENIPELRTCLSITGVINPKYNGNADICGQIDSSIKEILQATQRCKIQLHKGWTMERIQELLFIWDEYHLNDMRPYCEHQKQLWDLNAVCHFDVFKFTQASYQRSYDLRNSSMKRLEAGEQVQWTPDKVLFMSLDSEVKVPSEPSLADVKEKTLQWQTGILNTYYQYKEHFSKAAGWVRESEHPLGLLGKACPICGYRYGSEWLYRPIPASVMKTIREFPLTTVKPAWI